MFKTLKNEKGLTLIELIAVLVILGIIAAIAIPTIGNTISAQRQRAAEAEWSAIIYAARFYIANNDEVEAFSMADLVAAGNLSASVTLDEDAAGTAYGDVDIFLNDDGEPAIDETLSDDGDVYIDGFLVYEAA